MDESASEMTKRKTTVVLSSGRTSTLVILCALALVSCQAVASADNIALGKPVKLTPTSDYWLGDPPEPRTANSRKLWEDKDAAALVDGIHGLDQKWVQPATPCWAHASRPEITIDLGKVHLINRICFYSPYGGASFPVITAFLVSENGTDYKLAGAISSFGLPQGDQSYVHKFEVSDLSIRGRYVRLVMQAAGFLSVDEVEVFEAPAGATGQTAPEQPVITPEELTKLFDRANEARWVVGEWAEVKDQIAHQFQPTTAAKPTTLPEATARQVQEVDQYLERLDVSKDQAIAAFRAKYLELRARTAVPLFGSGLIYWQPDPWADLRGSAFPTPGVAAPKEISLSLWQNEYEHAALGITSLESKPTTVKIQVSPLRDKDNKTLDWTRRLWLREARAVPVRRGYRVLDALPLAGTTATDRAELIVPPGESRVLWLTFCSRQLPPGRYQAKLDILPVGPNQQGLTVPVTITVAGLPMPEGDKKTLNSYLWDYLKGWGAPKEATVDLHDHGVNTFILHPESLPQPRFNSDRTKVEEVNFKTFDEALARTGDPRCHGVFWGEGPADKFFDLKKASEQELCKQWIRLWVEHLQQKGYGPDRYFFYPYDEKVPENFVALARLIHEVDPRLRTYCNTINIAPELMARIGPYIGIWCPYYQTWDINPPSPAHRLTVQQHEAFAAVREKYHPLVWTYACDGPARTLSPGDYYRRLSWLAFHNKATGAGFWCYLSNNGTWDDFDGSDPDYSVVYYASDAPPDVPRTEMMISSRRWEACREGAEDYEYLHQLRETIEAAQKAGAKAEAIAAAEGSLTRWVKEVLDGTGGAERYDRARKGLTRAILDLQNETKP